MLKSSLIPHAAVVMLEMSKADAMAVLRKRRRERKREERKGAGEDLSSPSLSPQAVGKNLMPCDILNLIGQMSVTTNFIVAEFQSVSKKPRLATRSQFFSDQSDDDSHMEDMRKHSLTPER